MRVGRPMVPDWAMHSMNEHATGHAMHGVVRRDINQQSVLSSSVPRTAIESVSTSLSDASTCTHTRCDAIALLWTCVLCISLDRITAMK